MNRRRVSVLATLALMFVALPAHSVCGRPPPITVSPHRGVPVPTNARLFVTAAAAWRGDASITLVTAPRKGRPVARVGLKEQSWRAAGTDRFELTPLAPLEPSTAYELRSSRGEILGVFTTSVLEDKRPPAWGGIGSGSMWREPAGRVARAQEECGQPLIELIGSSPAVDDQTTTDDIRYALWVGKPGVPLDYGAPPLTWTSRQPGARQFTLHYGSSIAADQDFERPLERPLRVGIKAFDLAANATEASELTLD